MMDDFGAHVTMAAVAVWLIQQLKRSSLFPWMTAETDRINRWGSLLAAVLSGFGVHLLPLSWNPITHTLIVTVTGLDPYTIIEGVWGTFQTFVMQEMMYHGMLKPRT